MTLEVIESPLSSFNILFTKFHLFSFLYSDVCESDQNFQSYFWLLPFCHDEWKSMVLILIREYFYLQHLPPNYLFQKITK